MRKSNLMLSGFHGLVPGSAKRFAQPIFLALMTVATLTPTISYAQSTTQPLTTQQLSDIEQIEQLKARYFRLIDAKDWTNWGNVFTTDATVQAASLCINVSYSGRSQIVSSITSSLQNALTVHRGFMPEITLTSDTTATGTWEMEDRINYKWLGVDYHGYGNYSETYVKQNGQWYIQSTVLTRHREEVNGNIVGNYVNGVLTCR